MKKAILILTALVVLSTISPFVVAIRPCGCDFCLCTPSEGFVDACTDPSMEIVCDAVCECYIADGQCDPDCINGLYCTETVPIYVPGFSLSGVLYLFAMFTGIFLVLRTGRILRRSSI